MAAVEEEIMEVTEIPASTVGDTSSGKVEYIDYGEGNAVLVLHGSPGGCDQGAVMGAFLEPRGFRVIAPSRPGYLRTPLSEMTKTQDEQADLELALMDSLGFERLAVMCWSGGGPSPYRLAPKHADRVADLVGLAGANKKYKYAKGINGIEYSLLTGGLGT